MFKKFILTIIVFILVITISAAPLKTDVLDILGYVGNQCVISISLDQTPLYMQTGVYSFNMKDDFVQKLSGASLVNGTGFRFASWSLISNTNQIEVVINHDLLVNEIDPNYEVDYALAVECSKIPYNTTEAYKYGIIFTAADGPQTVNFTQATNESFVSVNNFGLFIRLDATSAEVSELPSGVYYSTITMEVNSL